MQSGSSARIPDPRRVEAVLQPATAFVPAQAEPLLGPAKAAGVLIWSHGRSPDSEDSQAPTPDYVEAFRRAGWDTFRFNRLRMADDLWASSATLAKEVDASKASGYRRVVLAGQSFGAFISLIAADDDRRVDAVIATAPAAFGLTPRGQARNATALFRALSQLHRGTRVALFFFQGDIFDPGGRAPVADEILADKHLAYLIVDRPASLVSHWASSSPSFTREFASCLAAFAADDRASGKLDCAGLVGGAVVASK